MIQTLRIALVFVLVAGIVTCGLPRPTVSMTALPQGAGTAAAAAALPMADAAGAPPAAGKHILAFGALGAVAQPDSSEFEFPDDGEKHLARDITVWVIATAFVAYFIVKVFIEKDDEEPKDNKPPGKQI